jgi:hypothetical protein
MSVSTLGVGPAVDRLTRGTSAVLPGTIVFLVAVGWLPLVAGVAGAPDAGDLAFFGAGLLGSGAYPWNVVALLLSLCAGIAAIVVLLAAGESEIIDRLSAEHRSSARVWRAAAVISLASLPAVLAVVGLGWAAALAAPAAYANPDPTDPFWAQVGRSVLPWLIVLSAAIALGQAFGATALREVGSSAGARHALRSSVHRFRRSPFRLIVVAVIGMSLVLMVLATTWMTVSTVWTQLAARLGGGRILDLQTIGLLTLLAGAWLGLLLVGGTLQAFLSAWWSSVLEEAP